MFFAAAVAAERRRMAIKGITRRWMINVLMVIIIVLCAIAVVSSVAMGQYYYGSVSRELHSPAGNASMYFAKYLDGTDYGFQSGARDFIENFPYKDRMEVWAISKEGVPYISTQGFLPEGAEVSMPDFQKALSSPDGQGEWIGKSKSGERIMAVTTVLYSTGGVCSGAVRYIASLTDIDKQIADITMLVAFVCVVVVALVVFSSLFFIKSIVNPVATITLTAERIAHGDFNARINKHYDDEIGELCNTINDMAGELGNADRMKNDFISTVSHELRTPLTAIKGWGETLREIGTSDPELLQKGLDVISHEAGRLAVMVEELLDFSRMQSGRMILRKEKIDVLAELDEAVFVFRERARREDREIVYSPPELPAPAYGDANRIKQVFVNVLDNAFKYTASGGKVSVLAELLEGTIKIEVSDNGCGIKKEDLQHVKEKFYKANKSVRGSGIGLAVTDEIIKLHGGQLLIESVEGEGTKITILLPALVTPVEEIPLIPEMERSSLDEPK